MIIEVFFNIDDPIILKHYFHQLLSAGISVGVVPQPMGFNWSRALKTPETWLLGTPEAFFGVLAGGLVLLQHIPTLLLLLQQPLCRRPCWCPQRAASASCLYKYPWYKFRELRPWQAQPCL